MKILHIEDNIYTAESFRKLIGIYEPEWEIIHSESVLKAFEKLNTEKFDIAVIDFHLDRIFKGYELKSVLMRLNTPYLYYSAETEENIREKDKTGRYISKIKTDIELIPVLIANFYYEAQNVRTK